MDAANAQALQDDVWELASLCKRAVACTSCLFDQQTEFWCVCIATATAADGVLDNGAGLAPALVGGRHKDSVPMARLVHMRTLLRQHRIYHKSLHFVLFIMLVLTVGNIAFLQVRQVGSADPDQRSTMMAN